MTTQFEVGKPYWTRSICDYDCILSFKILSRTAKTIRTIVYGNEVIRRVSVYQGVEQFRPYGNYSMAAIISADRAKELELI